MILESTPRSYSINFIKNNIKLVTIVVSAAEGTILKVYMVKYFKILFEISSYVFILERY
jgi:hypothetical protein